MSVDTFSHYNRPPLRLRPNCKPATSATVCGDSLYLVCVCGSLLHSDVLLGAAHWKGVPYKCHALDSDSEGDKIPQKNEDPHPDYSPVITNSDFTRFHTFISQKPCHPRCRGCQDKLGCIWSRNCTSNGCIMGWGDTDEVDNVATMSNVIL